MDILPEYSWLPLLTVGAGPAKLAVSTVITSEVSWFVRRGQWGVGVRLFTLKESSQLEFRVERKRQDVRRSQEGP